MNQRTLLKKTIALARTGDKGAFENLYILTAKNTYAKACDALRNTKDAEALFADTYIVLYRQIHEVPSSEGELDDKISDIMIRLVSKKTGRQLQGIYCDPDYYRLSDDRAATMWLWIEERAGFNRIVRREEKNKTVSNLYNIGKMLLAFLMIVLTVSVVYMGWGWINKDKKEQESSAVETTVSTAPEQTDIAIGEELLSPGWEEKADGNLYYVKKNGTCADGTVAVGKQQLTFSGDGKLTFIAGNPAISENPNFCFDESVRYEVKAGDIFKKDMSGTEAETSVTLNGHVVQADARCGYLWYISKFQVPNSEQVKTTVYRLSLSGGRPEELYTTDSTLKTEQFQVTEDWMYYISEGMLLRRSLKGGGVELMADNVENYFAWENAAYYMKDRELVKVSQGVDYSGIEAGYQIELQDKGFVLLDALGEEVKPDDSGEKQAGDRIYRIEGGIISSVRPAERENNGVTYYIDAAGSDRKIYSRGESGTQGLIRQEGISVDSLCLAGEWLYYSARVGEYGGEPGSQIYRLNMETLEQEPVGEGFSGYVKNLYYFDNLQTIFGEYIPATSDPQHIAGKIAKIPIGKNPESVDASGAVTAGEGSYMLELVMADGEKLYCLYHDCIYNPETGEMEYTSAQPVVINIG